MGRRGGGLPNSADSTETGAIVQSRSTPPAGVQLISRAAPPAAGPSMMTWSRHFVMLSAAGSVGCWNVCWLAGLWMPAHNVSFDSESGNGSYFKTPHVLPGRLDACIFLAKEAVQAPFFRHHCGTFGAPWAEMPTSDLH